MLTVEHTDACIAARRRPTGHPHGDVTPEWPQMMYLEADDQAAVLACPHPAHDAARMMYGVTL